MPQEITRTQIEKYTVYTGPTAESFSPIMAGITYPDPAYEILVYRRPLCVFEYVLSGRGHIERNGSILTVNAGDAYILTAGTYHHYYSDKVDPWTKIWFNVSGSLVQHLLSDYGLDGVTLIPRFHNETPLTRILDAFTADPVHSADKLAVLLHQYIQELADFLANKVPINPTALAIRNYIDMHLTESLSLDHLADTVSLSRSRLIHLFQEASYMLLCAVSVPGGISCCSLPVLPVPEVQAGPVHAKPHHSSCFCHLHTAWVLRPSPLFFLFQETVRSVPGFLQKTPHSAWEFSHLSIILSKNGTKATKLLF